MSFHLRGCRLIKAVVRHPNLTHVLFLNDSFRRSRRFNLHRGICVSVLREPSTRIPASLTPVGVFHASASCLTTTRAERYPEVLITLQCFPQVWYPEEPVSALPDNTNALYCLEQTANTYRIFNTMFEFHISESQPTNPPLSLPVREEKDKVKFRLFAVQ